MSKRPWYYEAGMKFGLPALASGYLIWFLVSVVNTKIDLTNDAMHRHQEEMNRELSSVVRLLNEQNDQQRQMLQQQWVQIGVFQRTCLNTSRTDEDRVACAAISVRPQ